MPSFCVTKNETTILRWTVPISCIELSGRQTLFGSIDGCYFENRAFGTVTKLAEWLTNESVTFAHHLAYEIMLRGSFHPSVPIMHQFSFLRCTADLLFWEICQRKNDQAQLRASQYLVHPLSLTLTFQCRVLAVRIHSRCMLTAW